MKANPVIWNRQVNINPNSLNFYIQIMKKAYTASSDESMSEDSSSDSEYRQKLERYRQLETMRNKQQEEKFEEDE